MTIKTITKEQWEILQCETWNTSMVIIETARILMENINTLTYVKDTAPKICAGLYTHAVEEYGKLLYLQYLVPKNGNVEVQYDKKDKVKDDWKFTSHYYKFELALNKLPSDCTVLHEGNFGSHNFGRHNFDVETIADWETRLNIFNTDFDDNGNVLTYPTIDVQKLQKAVFNFKTELLGTKLPEPSKKL